MTAKITILIIRAGIVEQSIFFAALYTSESEMAAEKLKPSDIGDWASPKNEPQQIAPTVTGAGIPIEVAMPSIATPTVPAVVQEEPVNVDIMAQRTTVKGRTIDGLKIFNPQ